MKRRYQLTASLDSTPTHSYMKYLYKYPHAAFPYSALIETNKRRNRGDMEYELPDTGVFNGDRYFDVFVEVAKQSPEDLLIQIRVINRGPAAATSMVGLLPLCATSVIEPWQRERAPGAQKILQERWQRMPELHDSVHPNQTF